MASNRQDGKDRPGRGSESPGCGHTVGFTYVMTNPWMPGLAKVGWSGFLAEDRADKLYTTGVPARFCVAYGAMTSRPYDVEQNVHGRLREWRVNPDREFFNVSPEHAVEALKLAAVEAAGIGSWKSQTTHTLRSGDRLALSLEASQVFAVVSYPGMEELLTNRSRIVDFWEAQSDGDLLEIFVTGSPTQVSGVSDDDPGCVVDPVPYLNRTGTAANGHINGRERLLPGDRLVWLAAPDKASHQSCVIFDAVDHCQVVGRTWTPKSSPDGFPLLINHYSHERLWPEAEGALRAVLDLPLPRNWAPRYDRGPEWAPIGTEPAPPDYWLTQLKTRSRKRPTLVRNSGPDGPSDPDRPPSSE